ncbi:MAG: DNA recombination protein RmuC, partial [Nocardioides sp.]|uniref:DNA recombination protein RmuC n=1 Tax=Nocardioides sp. TaxID=35761 RepID=UPI0039E61049
LGAALVTLRARGRQELAVAGAVAATRSELQTRVAHAESMMMARQDATVAQLLQHEAELRSATEAELAAERASVAALTRALEEVRRQQRDLIDAHRREAAERERAESGQAQVLRTIAPVAQQLQAMQARVDQMEKQRANQHGELAAQIRTTQIGVAESRKAADSLAQVLRNNNAVRGAWGEAQLRNLVESAGLLNRIDFELQHSMTADSGSRRPDMVLNLPGGKQMAIDAKVPYNAFMDAQREGIDARERERLLLDHAKRVRAHIDTLAAKGYWTGLAASPEFTIAFIPNEQILNAALDVDPSLLDHAFRSGVPLATPTNVYSMLKTIAFTWKQEALTEDAQQLFDLGQELYRRITTMAKHVDKLGRSLTTSVKDYNSFVGSLERSVLSTARKINATDASALLPAPAEVEESVRALTAGDFAGSEEPEARGDFEALRDLDRPELPEGIDRVVDAVLIADEADAV